MQVWGRATSINVQKVLWILEELGFNYRRHDLGGKFGGLSTQHYVAMNPSRRVPTLEDGSLILWESNVIVRYLARKDPERIFIGATLKDDARADIWMEWFQNNLYAHFLTVFHHAFRLKEENRDAQLCEDALQKLNEGYQLLDHHLEGQNFVCGDTLTMGDVPVGSSLYRYFTLPIKRPILPNVEAYYARLSARPTYQDYVMVSYDSLREV